MSDFSKKIKIYISVVFTIGVLLAAYLFKVYTINFNFDVFIFIVMAVIAESLLIPLPNQGGVSVGFAIVLPSIIFFGPGTAMLIVLLENILMIVKQGDKFYHIFNIPFYKTAFNVAMHFISAGIAALVYGFIGGNYSTFLLGQTFLPSLVSALIYIIINGLILAKLLAY